MKRKWLRRILLGILIAGAVCAITALSFSAYVTCAADSRIVTQEEAAALTEMDCILVLGCGVREDGSPSLMLRDRLNMGIALYKAGVAPKLLMSGDHSQVDYDEVNAMKDYAIAAGVPSEDIFMDHAGFSTYESMYRAKAIFQVERMVVVSQQYHLFRAVYNANELGIDTWGVAAADIDYFGAVWREFREVLARTKDWIWCIFQPDPTFLGEAIPISGNGNLSNG